MMMRIFNTWSRALVSLGAVYKPLFRLISAFLLYTAGYELGTKNNPGQQHVVSF
jgi:hypothetical protein